MYYDTYGSALELSVFCLDKYFIAAVLCLYSKEGKGRHQRHILEVEDIWHFFTIIDFDFVNKNKIKTNSFIIV